MQMSCAGRGLVAPVSLRWVLAVLVLCAVSVLASSTGEAEPAEDTPRPAWLQGFFITNCVWLGCAIAVLCVLGCMSRSVIFMCSDMLLTGVLIGVIASHHNASQDTDKVVQCIFFAMPCLGVFVALCIATVFACTMVVDHFRYQQMAVQ